MTPRFAGVRKRSTRSTKNGTRSVDEHAKVGRPGYTPIITKDDVKISNTADVEFTVKADAVLRGWREKDTGLWRIPIGEGIDKDNVDNANTQTVLTQMAPTTILKEKNVMDFMCNIYELRKQQEIVRFLHAAAGFPTKGTWLKAIKKEFYSAWPGLIARAAEKYFPRSEKPQKGHMHSIKAGIKSTKKETTQDTNKDDEDNGGMEDKTKRKELVIKHVDLEEEFKNKSVQSKQADFHTGLSKAINM